MFFKQNTKKKKPTNPKKRFLWLALAQAEALALRYAGSFHRLERRAAELLAENLAAPQWAGDAVIALYRGCAALVAGRPGRAIRWLSEALAGLDTSDPTGNLPLCLAELAIARALVGDVQPARDIVGEPGGTFRQVPPLFRPQARLAEAWLAAADGHTEEAAVRCVEAADEGGAMGQRCVEAVMLHGAARFGAAATVRPRLTLLAEEVDSPLVAVCATHVDALVAGDGRRLDEVSRRFEEMGALLLAAEAATDAAGAHQATGDRPAAGLSRAAAAALTRRCEVSRAPGLPEDSGVRLTAREEEVAHLAARGQTNQDIAAHLVVSVRTVETHLAHVYAKLGISSRRSLAEMLG